MGPPGLTYLTYRWRVKQGEEKNKAQAKNVAMHLCVCLITLILPLIICNLSNLALHRLLALLKDSFTRHETSNVHAAYETRTPVIYT